MGDKTSISWCDRTWNGWVGCQKVSSGCLNCYAERDFTRKPRWANTWGPPATTERKRTTPQNWNKPYKWNNENWIECAICKWRGPGTSLADLATSSTPTCPNCDGANCFTGARQRVFAFSLGDVFEQASQVEQWREDFFFLTQHCKNIDWLVLTKRIEHVADSVSPYWMEEWPENVWIGTSVESDECMCRLEYLDNIPAKVRFLSLEPLIGSINHRSLEFYRGCFNWAIVGGESGPNARPMKEEWALTIKDFCLDNDIPFHFKQWGEFDRLGQRKGRKNIPPILDGQEWKEFPSLSLTGRTQKLVIS